MVPVPTYRGGMHAIGDMKPNHHIDTGNWVPPPSPQLRAAAAPTAIPTTLAPPPYPQPRAVAAPHNHSRSTRSPPSSQSAMHSDHPHSHNNNSPPFPLIPAQQKLSTTIAATLAFPSFTSALLRTLGSVVAKGMRWT